ncbi:MAG: hypothetical protein AAB606_04455 [Patescibacteria group bacterium]
MKKIALATLLTLLTLVLASCFYTDAQTPTSTGPSGAPRISAPPSPSPGQK